MHDIHPRVLLADIWSSDGRLGKTLDALFAHKGRDIAGLLIGYDCAGSAITVTGPGQFAARDNGEINIFEDLPTDDGIAAAMGRAIQATFSASHISDYLENIQDDCPILEDDETLHALFTPNALFLFQDDPWQVIDTYPLESSLDTAAAQICTIVLRPAQSAHEKLSRGKGVVADLATFYAFQSNGLDLMKAQGVARLVEPRPADLASIL